MLWRPLGTFSVVQRSQPPVRTKTKTECLNEPLYAIFSTTKNRGFKDIKYDIFSDPSSPLHWISNTLTQQERVTCKHFDLCVLCKVATLNSCRIEGTCANCNLSFFLFANLLFRSHLVNISSPAQTGFSPRCSPPALSPAPSPPSSP